ncbi:unnamed protein product [Linum tenue]|uniref:Uncharacterized protein n=1 Tax=Linum tenue TaxID=586396 RepID=A0AAV0MC45_9ROSI|nr:unnamed protein product [Linum tenue]
MAWSPASPAAATQQWTFIGEHDLEVDSYQGELELKISAQLKERTTSTNGDGFGHAGSPIGGTAGRVWTMDAGGEEITPPTKEGSHQSRVVPGNLNEQEWWIGKVTDKIRPKSKNEQGNSADSQGKKGKEVLKGDPKKGKHQPNKGKGATENENMGKDGRQMGSTQVWRSVGPKQKEVNQAYVSMVTDKMGAHTEKDPSTSDPTHGKNMIIENPPIFNGVPSSTSVAEETKAKESIRKHYKKRSLNTSSSLTSSKQIFPHILKTNHGLNPTPTKVKRVQQKRKIPIQRKVVEDFLAQLHLDPLTGDGKSEEREVYECMVENTESATTTTDEALAPDAPDRDANLPPEEVS